MDIPIKLLRTKLRASTGCSNLYPAEISAPKLMQTSNICSNFGGLLITSHKPRSY